jgi:hypothetical protein
VERRRPALLPDEKDAKDSANGSPEQYSQEPGHREPLPEDQAISAVSIGQQ